MGRHIAGPNGGIGDKGKQAELREGEPSKLTVLENWGLHRVS